MHPQLVVGGTTPPAEDLSVFLRASPNVLIGTPGRLLALLASPHVHAPQTSFEALVLDEADRLLDLGFKDELQRILMRLPKQRRTGLFSASVSEAVDQLIRVGLRNPVRVNVRVKAAARGRVDGEGDGDGTVDRRTPASLQISYIVVPPAHKLPAVTALLERLAPPPQKTILYLSTCFAVDYFQHILPTLLPSQVVIPLHGKLADQVRRRNFAKFAASTTPSVLLTTDVAARGLDVPAVDVVIQFDPPSDPKTFIHRCGRAGRAGRKGLAVTLLTPGREEDYVEFMRVRQTPLGVLRSPDVCTSAATAADATTQRVRALVLADRALHDRAQRGFVSWVRAYSKHAARSIFRTADLPWDQLAAAWGLLRLPRMPELQTWPGDRGLGLTVDWDALRYRDKTRERARQAQLRAAAADAHTGPAAPNAGGGQRRSKRQHNAPWSRQRDQAAVRTQRRDKKHVKRANARTAHMTADQRGEQDALNAMIAQVRAHTAAGADAEAEWRGFSD